MSKVQSPIPERKISSFEDRERERKSERERERSGGHCDKTEEIQYRRAVGGRGGGRFENRTGRRGACHVTECIRRRSVLQTGAMRFDEDVGRCVPIVNTGWPVKRCGLGRRRRGSPSDVVESSLGASSHLVVDCNEWN